MTLRLTLAVLLLATPVGAAGLRPQITTADAVLTLGEVFDGVGDQGGVEVARLDKPGQRITLDAGRLQAFAARHGISWANTSGLRRIVAERPYGAASPATSTGVTLDDYTVPGFDQTAPAPQPARAAPAARTATIRKGDVLRVYYSAEGIMLSVKGRALEDGEIGQTIRIENIDSARAVDARIADRGMAVIDTPSDSHLLAHISPR